MSYLLTRKIDGTVNDHAEPGGRSMDRGEPIVDVVQRYLPGPFFARLPEADRWWRGRAILLTWALGFPLEMAWSYAMSRIDGEADELRELMARLDDLELVAQLEATAELRGDGSHLEFVSLGDGVAGDLLVS
jgi:hypothetical protein